MKKYIAIFSLMLGLNTSAATIEVYNLTSYNFNYQLNTVNSSTFSYPILWSTNTLLTLAPGFWTDYGNSGGFPFNPTSGTNTPAIVSWVRQTVSGGAQTATSNTTAQTVFGTTQVIAFLKYSFTGVAFSGNWGPHGDFPYFNYNSGQIILEYIDMGGGNAIFLAQ
ncbi:hypothetical protein [Flavobacterium caeni]|uniref:Uncharacterized protein n=1 Tax=Flavobacterium caeni TaxID=490189 RepID=A0A1G5KF85_9FLAO|nr:hypothetical protein [Flavobacterium caeni]SCY99236.1 hypothetical protein SAMN02927903_03274 [Flavobacterium caeni]